MPPIDPRLIAPPQQGQTLAGPAPTSAPIIPNGTVMQPSNVYSNQNTQANTNRTNTLLPAQADEAKTNAEIARLNLRALRIKNGMDPDTGKLSPNVGVAGEMGIQDLSPVDQAKVKAIVTGRFPVSPYMLARNPDLGKLVDRAFQYEPGTDLTIFQRRNAAFQKFMSDPKSPVVRLNQALEHLGTFYDAARALNNSNSSFISLPENLAHQGKMQWTQDPRVTAFNTAKNQLATELAAAFKGGNNPSEAAILRDLADMSLHQSPSQYDAFAKTAANLLGGRIDANQYQFQQALGPSSDAFDLIAPKAKANYDKFSAAEFGTPGANNKEVSDKEQTTFTLPQGYQDEHSQFLANHPKGSLTVPDYLAFRQRMDKKYGNPGAPLSSDLDPKTLEGFVKAYNQQGLSPNTKVPTANIPLTPDQHDLAKIAEGPVGAFAANAGNALALGLPEAILGEDKRQLFHNINDKESLASTLGDVAGSVAPISGLEKGGMALIERLASGLKPTARMKLLGSIGANAGYGTVRGFDGANDGEGGTGALEGGLGGAAGALGGNFATRGLTPLVSDATAKALQSLKGVNLTVLQRLGLGEGEQMLKSVPFAHGAMKNAMKSYNVAQANDALSHIGEVVPKGIPAGPELNAHVNTVASNFYDRIKPQIVGSVDSKFDGIMKVLEAQADTPAKKAMFDEIRSATNSLKDANGHFNGESYQTATSKLRDLVEAFSNDTNNPVAAQQMSRVADAARKQIKALVSRQVPENVATDLSNVEKTWAKKALAEDATRRALAGQGGIYSPSQKLTSIKLLDTSKGKGASARGLAPGQPETMAAQDIMGTGSVPTTSSLKESSIAALALGAGHWAAPGLTPVLGGTAAALYTPLVRRLTKAIVTPEGGRYFVNEDITRNAIADALRHRMTGN